MISLAPTAPVTYGNLGAALQETSQTQMAIESNKTAIRLLDDDAGEYRARLENTFRQLKMARRGEAPQDSAE